MRRLDRVTGGWEPRLVALLAVVVVLGVITRCAPLLVTNGAQASTGFDEGVYASAAGLLSQGVLPYRDFVLLHPPGLSVLLAPLAAAVHHTVGWDGLVPATRWLSVFVGLLNMLLVAVIAGRWRGPRAAVIAAAVYAAYPPAIATEGHVLLEPFVILAVLLSALLWLKAQPSAPSGLAAGSLIGVAAAIKLTGGLAFPALLLADRLRTGWRPRLAAVLGAATAFAVIVVPFAVLGGPARIVRLLLRDQTQRPAGDAAVGSIVGVPARVASVMGLEKLPDGAATSALGVVLLAAFGALLAWAWRSNARTGRFWTAFFVIVLAAELSSPDFFFQYPATLGPPLAIVVGGALATLVDSARVRSPRWAPRLATALALLLGAAVVGETAARLGTLEQAADFGAVARLRVGRSDCITADPPTLALAAGRLPMTPGRRPLMIDPFGALVDASLDEGRPTTIGAALTGPAAQRTLRSALTACRYVALDGPPGAYNEFSAATVRWFTVHYRVDATVSGGATLWSRR